MCEQFCRGKGAAKYGLQYGHECWCGEGPDFDQHGAGVCNYRCSGNLHTTCGGCEFVFVYLFCFFFFFYFVLRYFFFNLFRFFAFLFITNYIFILFRTSYIYIFDLLYIPSSLILDGMQRKSYHFADKNATTKISMNTKRHAWCVCITYSGVYDMKHLYTATNTK